MFDKLVELLVQSIRLFQFFTVVRDFEGGVVLRFGKYNRHAEPGFHFLWPFKVEELVWTIVVPETMIVGPQSLTTKDGKTVVVRTVVTFCVEDVKKYLLEISGTDQLIEDATYGVVAHEFMERNYDECRAMDIANEIAKTMRRQAKQYGVNIMRVQLADFTLARSLRLMQEHVNKFPSVQVT